jgi:hypothetical protein
MAKQVAKYIVGAITLFVLSLGIEIAISLKLFLSESIIEWINSASNPRFSLWLISILIVSSILTLIKIGVKLPLLTPWIESSIHPLISYLLGLPLLVTIAIAVLAGVSLAFLGPRCESPTANVKVTSLDDSIIYYDGKSLTVKAGSTLTVEALPNENTVVFCVWSSTGKAITNIGPKSACISQIELDNEPGKGIVTLTLSKSFCSVSSTHPIEIITVP